jgi:hypothetical protein
VRAALGRGERRAGRGVVEGDGALPFIGAKGEATAGD